MDLVNLENSLNDEVNFFLRECAVHASACIILLSLILDQQVSNILRLLLNDMPLLLIL